MATDGATAFLKPMVGLLASKAERAATQQANQANNPMEQGLAPPLHGSGSALQPVTDFRLFSREPVTAGRTGST